MTGRHKILATLGGLLVLALAGVWTADGLARSAVESAIGRAVGTETTLEGMDLGVLSGEATLEGLRVSNPDGFESPEFLTLRSGRVAVDLLSLLADTVEIRQLTLEGMELTLEQRGTSSNVTPILASVREATADQAPEDETRYRVREMVIRDVRGNVRLGTGVGQVAEATVEVPEIRLEDVGTGRGGGVVLSELAALTVRAVLRAVARPSGGLPASLRGLVRRELGSLPGSLEIRLPGSEEGASLRDQAEETLRELVPGPDDDG